MNGASAVLPRGPRFHRRTRAFACLLAVGTMLAALPSLGASPAPHADAQPPLRLAASSPAVNFASPMQVGADSGPFGVATGDFNGDGKPDVVDADNGANNVSVLLGRGDGSFRPAAKYAVGSCPLGVAVGSLRGNGITDIVTANNCGGNFSVLLGNGDGTFQPAVNYAVHGSPWGIALADFNKDGRLDVVVSDDGTQDVAVLLGNGDGTFQAPSFYAGNHGGENGVAVGDFNGDGYPDIVAADGGPPGADPASISVFMNLGTGTFGAVVHYYIGNTYAVTHSVVVGDVNRDGKPDIVVVNINCGYNGGDVLVLLGNGDGTFQGTRSLNDGCPSWATIADINGDGIPDVVSINPSGFYNSYNNLRVFISNGDGTFQSPVYFSIPSSNPQGVTAVDLNHDGKVDVVTADQYGADSDVYINTSPTPPAGGVPSSSEHSAGASGTAPYLQGSCGCYGQPIDTAYGNFWHTFNDLAVTGRGIPLSLTRTYSSVNASASGPLGFGWTVSYNMSLSTDPVSGNATIHEENGGQVTFTLSGGVYSAAPRDIATLVKNGDGSFTFVRQARERYMFNAAGQLTAITDLNGYSTTLSYNGGGQLASVTDPASRSLVFTWTGSTLTQVSDPIGRTVRYAYNDGLGNLTDVTDANGGVTHFTYDANHLLLTMQDPLGQITTNVYTGNRVTSQTETVVANDRTKDRTTTYAYTGDNSSQTGGTVTITDPKGNVTVEQYTYGERTSVTKGYGTAQAATWNYSYDPATLAIVTVSDPNGHTTLMSYDASGNLLMSTDPLGRSASSTFDGLNDLTSTTDPNGVTTTLVYDTAGNLQSRSTPLVGSSPLQTQTTLYHYGDPAHPGDVTSITDPDTKVWQTSYDADGDVASQTDPLGDLTTHQYNAIGWKTSSVSPRGNVTGCNCASQYTTTYNYTDLRTGSLNGFGDVGTTTDPLGHTTQTTYDPNRNVISSKDGDGKVTQYTYDLADEQTVVSRADQTTLKTDYNSDGTVLDQVDGLGRATSYGYDSLARVTSVTDPLNRITSQTYDGVGNRLTVVDPQGQTTTDTYDAANEMKAIQYSDRSTPNVSNITYDGDGQRTGMTDGTGTSSWSWDSLHRLTSATNGNGQLVGYGYDLKSQLTSITYPGNNTVMRVYDDAGRLHTVGDWLGHTTTYNDDPDSNVTTQAYPNGTTAGFTLDAAQRLMAISDAPTTSPSSTFASFTYGRDSNNQLTSVASTGVPADNNTYGYTALNQVNQVGSSTYGYDAADNVTGLRGGITQSYDVANELTQVQSTISLVGTASAETSSGTSVTVSLPSGVQPNDQVVVTTTQSATVTAGVNFTATQVASAQTGTHNGDTFTAVLLHTAGSGDTALSFTYSKATAATVLVAVYRGVNPNAPIDAASTGTTASGTQVAAPSLTTTVSGDRLIMVEGATGRKVGAWTQPTAMTDEVHQSDMSAAASALGDQVLGAAGATGTRTATYGQSTALVGVLFALKPAVTAYSYDPRGNRTTVTPSGGVATNLAYDQANRLTSYGSSVTYGYNGDGLRMSKTMLPSYVTTQFTWDVAEGQPLLLYDGSTSYVYGPGGQPLEQISSSGSVLYFHQDQLGSTRLLTDQSGTVQGAFTYDAYGNLIGHTGTATTPLGYAGQYTDAETGLQYLRARYYDPATAQFLSRDPAVATTRQPYGYVTGNPLNATDPSGLDQWARSPGPSGLDPSDPNYCWELTKMIREQNRQLSDRWHVQQQKLDQLVSGDLEQWTRYMGHRSQFYIQRRYLRSLIKEYDNGPCRGNGLSKGVADWAQRGDPADESGDPLLVHAMRNPPPASSSYDVGPNWLAVLAGIGIIGQTIFAPETLPLDLAA